MRSVVVEDEFRRNDDIAIDWVYNNIYWTCGARRTISVTNLSGDFTIDVVDDELPLCRVRQSFSLRLII